LGFGAGLCELREGRGGGATGERAGEVMDVIGEGFDFLVSVDVLREEGPKVLIASEVENAGMMGEADRSSSDFDESESTALWNFGGGTRLGGMGSDCSSTAGVCTIIQSSDARDAEGMSSFSFFDLEGVSAAAFFPLDLSSSLCILYSSLGGMICWPTLELPCLGRGFGIGGGSSLPKRDDVDERAEDWRWKKRDDATSEELGEDDRVVVLGRGLGEFVVWEGDGLLGCRMGVAVDTGGIGDWGILCGGEMTFDPVPSAIEDFRLVRALGTFGAPVELDLDGINLDRPPVWGGVEGEDADVDGSFWC
jgi:hypothetical protein